MSAEAPMTFKEWWRKEGEKAKEDNLSWKATIIGATITSVLLTGAMTLAFELTENDSLPTPQEQRRNEEIADFFAGFTK